MATISLGFNLSASAVQMATGINAGVVELEKLGLAAKKTQRDVGTLKTIELSRAFISTIQTAANAFSSFIGGTAGAVAAIDDLSKRTGISADVIQGYSLAANQSGVSLETFGRAIQKLTVNLGEAQTGNKDAVKSFADLGLAVGDLSSLNPEQAFNAVVAAISKLPNPAQQAAAAVGLFGKSGVELVPIFQEGATYLQQMAAEAKRLGVVLSPQQTAGIAALDDSLQKTQLTLRAFSARILSELAPALTKAAEDAATFIASINVREVSATLTAAISSLANAFTLLSSAAGPLAGNILPAIGGYLAFINRQVISAGIARLGSIFTSAAAAAFGYSAAAGTAATATAALAVSIRGLLASTGIGAVVVLLGIAAGAAIELAVSASSAGAASAVSFESPTKAARSYADEVKAAMATVRELGQESKDALKVPALTAQDFAQDAIDEANAAIKSLAKELGGLNQVPADLLERFRDIKSAASGITTDSLAFNDAIAMTSRDAQSLTTNVRDLTEAWRADAQAAKAAADAARQAIPAAGKASVAVSALSNELGSLRGLPAILFTQFMAINGYAEGTASATVDFGGAVRTAGQDAQSLTNALKRTAEARKLDADAIKASSDAARKAASESRQRVSELATAGISDAEKSRLQLNKDILAIVIEQRSAEEALAAAKRAGDTSSIAAARGRLALSQQAAKQAKDDDRNRQLDALGIDKTLLRPAKTLADEFKAVREAFDKKLINGGEAAQALRNLAQEGIAIRREIAAELSRPAASALEVNDIRSSQGASQFMALATGREDPAIAQRREQLQKLEQIRQGLIDIGARPVDILGGA